MRYTYLPKIAFAFSLIFLLTTSVTSKAQTADSVSTDYRARNVFIELGGVGLSLSANYDTRFANTRDGFGMRLGVGYFKNTDLFFSVPLQVNYLIGKKSHFAEIGAGVTYDGYRGHSWVFFSPTRQYPAPPANYQHTFVGTTTFGYRYQPFKGGLNFRANMTVAFNSLQVDFIPGISVGYTFK